MDQFSDRLMRNVERVIAFHPTYDSRGKKDATHAFIPEARTFVNKWGSGDIFGINNKKPLSTRRERILEVLGNMGTTPVDIAAFFCHGQRNGIQLGFRNSHIEELVRGLENIDCTGDLIVVLYCCSVAKGGEDGEGSFADRLRDALCKSGSIHTTVIGHYTAGHTTRNPYVRIFTGAGSEYGGTGGYRPVSPKSPLWKGWKSALNNTDFRFRFPALTLAAIHQELIKCYL